MRKIVAFLLATTLLLSMCISVSAAESAPQPRYINTNQAKVVMGISDSGLAEITVTCLGNSNATSIQITTLIISKKPGNTGISRNIRTEFTTDLLLSD